MPELYNIHAEWHIDDDCYIIRATRFLGFESVEILKGNVRAVYYDSLCVMLCRGIAYERIEPMYCFHSEQEARERLIELCKQMIYDAEHGKIEVIE